MTDAEKIVEIIKELFNRIKSLEIACESNLKEIEHQMLIERKSEAILIQNIIYRIVKGENK
jgi:hypothetical protein